MYKEKKYSKIMKTTNIKEELLEKCSGKMVHIVFVTGKQYTGLCTEYMEPILEDEEPTIFSEPTGHFLKVE